MTEVGMNLSWIRNLVGVPAKWHSAKDAADALDLTKILSYDDVPLGALVFYDMEPWGDVGLVVDRGMVLRSEKGHVFIELLSASKGTMLGWVSSQNFREISEEETDAPMSSTYEGRHSM